MEIHPQHNNSEKKLIIVLLASVLGSNTKKNTSSVSVCIYVCGRQHTWLFMHLSSFYRSEHKFRPFITFALEYETFECGTNKENPRIRLKCIHFNNKMENLV